MAEWLYLFTRNPRYPDPAAEVSALLAFADSGRNVFLPLADRASPPMKTATPGDVVILCTRQEGALRKRAQARIDGRPKRMDETPASVRELYGSMSGRFFVPLSDLVGVVDSAVPELTTEEQQDFARGRAFVKCLSPTLQSGVSRPRELAVDALPSPIVLSRQLVQSHPRDEVVVGLDPSAGDWDGVMRAGRKLMWSVALLLRRSGIIDLQGPAQSHLTNEAFWKWAESLKPSRVCIDGPCAVVGPRILPNWSGWDPESPDGVRDGERQLAAQGIGLFWTTKATVLHFDGASRWIARSLRLFEDTPAACTGKVIETHPHGAFVMLARTVGIGRLAPKQTPLGRKQRLLLLRGFIKGISPSLLPNHDAVDACCAALVGVLHRLGRVRPFGSASSGGVIWMPDV